MFFFFTACSSYRVFALFCFFLSLAFFLSNFKTQFKFKSKVDVLRTHGAPVLELDKSVLTTFFFLFFSKVDVLRTHGAPVLELDKSVLTTLLFTAQVRP